MSTLPSETVNMKIGIVGLIPPQIKQLEARLPGYDLTFLPRDIESKPANVTTFCKSMDKVILVTKFLGHKTQDHVPNSKRVLVSGGASMIIRRIKELMGCPASQIPINVAPPSEIPASAFTSGRIKPTKVRSESVPAPVKTQKTQPQKPTVPQSREVLVVKPAPDGRYDYSILTAAVGGDTVRFPLPADMKVSSWRIRMHSARHYYSKQSSFSFVLEFHEKYADIKIIDPDVAAAEAAAIEAAGKARLRQLEEERAAQAAAQSPTVKPAHKARVTKKAKTATAAPPEATVGSQAETLPLIRTADRPFLPHHHPASGKDKPAPTVRIQPSPAPVAASPLPAVKRVCSEERLLWRETFMVCFQRGYSATMATAEADTVLALYQTRFKASLPVG